MIGADVSISLAIITARGGTAIQRRGRWNRLYPNNLVTYTRNDTHRYKHIRKGDEERKGLDGVYESLDDREAKEQIMHCYCERKAESRRDELWSPSRRGIRKDETFTKFSQSISAFHAMCVS